MDTLTKETFTDLVRDAGGMTAFLFALYQKLIALAKQLIALEERVERLEGIDQGTVDNWVQEAIENDPDQTMLSDKDGLFEPYEDEQMLGDRSPYGWHNLHPGCPSWRTVRWFRQKIISDVVAQGIFKTPSNQVESSVMSAIHRNTAFAPYRHWVWSQTGDPQAKPAVAGLDPWAYLEGLQELASPADDPNFRNRFIEIHIKGGSR